MKKEQENSAHSFTEGSFLPDNTITHKYSRPVEGGELGTEVSFSALPDKEQEKETRIQNKLDAIRTKAIQSVKEECDDAFNAIEQAYQLGKKDALKEKEEGWISVKERLPEKNKYVLAFYTREHDGDKQVKTGLWENGWILQGTDSNNFRRVTHWMPLPNPPKA